MTDPCESWESRIARRITANGEAVVSSRIAAWLEKKAGVTPDMRSRLRDSDPEAHEVLMALHLSTQGRCASATKIFAGQHVQSESVVWLNTAEAARHLNVTPSAVRKWCSTGRLPATKSGRDWLIRSSDLHIHKLSE